MGFPETPSSVEHTPPRAEPGTMPASSTRPDLRVVLACLCLGALVGRWTAPSGWACEDAVFDQHGDPKIYARAEVDPAPAGDAPRGSFSFSDARGTYERREFEAMEGDDPDDPPYVNIVRTFPGQLRSGDVHKCHQVNVLAFGRARVTTVDERGRERTRIVAGGDRVVIPAHTPHLYEFLEDTVMTESWVHARDRTRCAFEAWFHAPLRDRVGDPKKSFAERRRGDAETTSETKR